MAQTNYGRKLSGTNYFPFAEILKPALARIATGQASGNAYYTLASVSNLVMDLYTNSPGYTDSNGQPNPNSANNPYAVFYSGDIALDIAARFPGQWQHQFYRPNSCARDQWLFLWLSLGRQ